MNRCTHVSFCSLNHELCDDSLLPLPPHSGRGTLLGLYLWGGLARLI
jgi:hypothetical protein